MIINYEVVSIPRFYRETLENTPGIRICLDGYEDRVVLKNLLDSDDDNDFKSDIDEWIYTSMLGGNMLDITIELSAKDRLLMPNGTKSVKVDFKFRDFNWDDEEQQAA